MDRLRNARPWLVLAGGDFIYKGVMAVYWVLLARKMSIDNLGILALANAIGLPAFVIIDAGLNAILVRDYSETGGLPAAHRRRVNQRLVLSLGLLVPLAGLGYLLGGSAEAALATGLMAFAYFCDFGGQLMLAPARAATKMEPDALVRSIQAFGAVGITIVFIAFGKVSPDWIAFASAIAYAAAMLPAWRIWRASRGWGVPERAEENTLPGDTGAISQGIVLMSAFGRADSILVQVILGPAALATYTVAYKLLEVARLIPGAVSRIVLARASDAASESYDLKNHLRLSIGLSLIGTAVIILAGPQLIGLLFGADYRGLATTPVRILGLSIVPFAVTTIGSMYVIGTGRGDNLRRVAVESLGVLLVSVIVLAEAFGLAGAAWGMLISQVYAAVRFFSVMGQPRGRTIDSSLVEEAEALSDRYTL